jgi:hypothetical protein
MDALFLAAGLALPWLLGMAAIAAARSRDEPFDAQTEIAWIAGTGYLAGAFLLTLWMRALSQVGIRFGVVSIALPLTIATVVLVVVTLRRDRALLTLAPRNALRALVLSPGLSGGARLIWWLLVGWLALRFVLLALEVTWQPLYPWDAWIQWATKARVWYELGYIAPFARAPEWLASGGGVYFDASPEYPPTVPLLQVWASIALGHWDDALMNWPWWQISVALTLAVYGGLRRLGSTPLTSLIGAFLVASLPLANVHVALAGYADLPLAAYFTVAVLAFLCWNETRNARDAALALLLLIACSQTKNPGVFWALTVVPAIAVVLFPRHGLRLAGLTFSLALLLLAVLAQIHVNVFNYTLHLDFDPAWRALGESFFLLGNWNLLWYGVIGMVLLLRRKLIAPPLAPFTVIIAGGLLFLFLVFGFTNAREWVAQQTTVNRATLHLAPLITVWLVYAFQTFAAQWRAAHPATKPSASMATPDAAPAAPPAL